jgi:hypothetical protein
MPEAFSMNSTLECTIGRQFTGGNAVALRPFCRSA